MSELNILDSVQHHDYPIDNELFTLAFFALTDNPNILTPVYFKDGIEIGRFDTMYADIQESIQPNMMTELIVNNFNIAVSQSIDGDLTWSEKLLAFFRTRVVLVDNRLKITE